MALSVQFEKINQRTTMYGVTAIAVIATIICALIGMHQSVWFDEAYSMMVAKRSFSEIIHLTSLDTHPPLYYVILHIWGNLFHWHVMALRILSEICYGVSIVGAGLLVKRLFGNRAALWASLFVALSPLLMRYGFEVRMYAMASTIGIGATLVLIKALEAQGEKRQVLWWVCYAILVAIGMYTLYYLAFLWIAHLAWLLFSWWRTSRRNSLRQQPWLVAYMLSIVFFVPWLPTFFAQIGNGALAPIGQAMNTENVFGVLSFNTLYRPLWQLDAGTSVLYLLFIGGLVGLSIRARHMFSAKEWSKVLLLIYYIGVPITLLVTVSFVRGMYVERYLAHVAIGLMMYVGVVVARVMTKPHRWTKALVISMAAACVVGIIQLVSVGNYNFQRLQRPSVDAAVAHLSCRTDSAVVAADPYVMIELSAYLDPKCQLRFHSDQATLRGGYAPLDHSALMFTSTQIPRLASTIYYIYYDNPSLRVPDKSQQLISDFGSLHIMKLTVN